MIPQALRPQKQVAAPQALEQCPSAKYAAVPAELVCRPQWVAYKLLPNPRNRNKPKKMPVEPNTGNPADVTDASTWGTFEEAIACANRLPPGSGIGYVLTEEDGLVFIDLDGCMDAEGNVAEWAQQIVSDIDSYTEGSPSGQGLHILAKGKLPSNGRKKADIEMYGAGRFMTVTGQRLPDTLVDIQPRDAAIAQFYIQVFGEPEPDKPANIQPAPRAAEDLDNDTLLMKIRESKQGEKFNRLWEGNWRGKHRSQSEADMALCTILAFWTGGDADRIDELFRQSGLMRKKWDERRKDSTYGWRTIEKALQTSSAVYTPALPQEPARHVWLDTGEVALLSDILAFVRWKIDTYPFTGRNRRTQKDTALALVGIFEKKGAVEAPISLRHLALIAGYTPPTVKQALLGKKDQSTGEQNGPALTDWLVTLVKPGNRINAGVYCLSETILDEYRQKPYTIVPTGVCLRMCKVSEHIHPTEVYLNDDAFMRNGVSPLTPEDIVSNQLGEPAAHVACVDSDKSQVHQGSLHSFSPTGRHIITELNKRNRQSINELAEVLGVARNTVSNALKRMGSQLAPAGYKPLVEIIQDPEDRHRNLVVLLPDWEQSLALARQQMRTYGTTLKRKAEYTQERQKRSAFILEHSSDPEKRKRAASDLEKSEWLMKKHRKEAAAMGLVSDVQPDDGQKPA